MCGWKASSQDVAILVDTDVVLWEFDGNLIDLCVKVGLSACNDQFSLSLASHLDYTSICLRLHNCDEILC